MGGKALKLPPIPRTKYLSMVNQLKNLMPYLYFPTALVKAEHGDIDVLYTDECTITVAEKTLQSASKKVNGNVTSLEWQGHQVDFIKCDPEWIEFARHWYSYGDRARILGKTYKHYGLSLKFTGLWYGNKLLTTDWYKALDVLKFQNILSSVDKYDLELCPYVSREIYPDFGNLRNKVSWHRKLMLWLVKLTWR